MMQIKRQRSHRCDSLTVNHNDCLAGTVLERSALVRAEAASQARSKRRMRSGGFEEQSTLIHASKAVLPEYGSRTSLGAG